MQQRLSTMVLFEKNLKDLNINYCSVFLERIEVFEGWQGTLWFRRAGRLTCLGQAPTTAHP